MKYKSGKQNALADALSHKPDYELAHVATMLSPVTYLACAAYTKDDHGITLLCALGSKAFIDSDIKPSARLRTSLH